MSFYSGAGGIAVAPLTCENLPAVAAEFDGPALRAAILNSQRNGQEGVSLPDPSLDPIMPLATHEDYFAQCTAEAQALLLQVQCEVERQVQGAARCIGYSMPAFRQERIFFYFAAFKKHLGIYPPLARDEALISETARFRGPKGNLSFPYAQSLPLKLIGRVAKALAAQYSEPTPRASKAGLAPC
jgi:uncharacterized protein YdhG (YjbR/CyaY superfamily)